MWPFNKKKKKERINIEKIVFLLNKLIEKICVLGLSQPVLRVIAQCHFLVNPELSVMLKYSPICGALNCGK